MPPHAGRGALLIMAIALVLVGLTDITLALIPPGFGDPEWRFTALASVANGLPVLSVGALTLGGVSTFGPPSRWLMPAALINGLLVLMIAFALAGFAGSVGPVLGAAPPEVHPGLLKATAKSLVFFVAFGAAHVAAVFAGASALRASRLVAQSPHPD